MPYIYRPQATASEQWKPSEGFTPRVSTGGVAPIAARFGVAKTPKGPMRTGVSGGAFGSLFSDPGPGLSRQGSRSEGRGVPERLDADVMGVVDTAVRTPASILERPVAIANRLTGGAIANGEDGGILGAIGNFQIGPIKPVGDLVGAANNILEFSGNLVPAAVNSQGAGLLAAYGDKPNDFVIPGGIAKTGGGLFGIGAHDMTVGELKADLERRGFLNQKQPDGSYRYLSWDELIDQIKRGGVMGTLQFGDRAISDNMLMDTAFRIVADPTNLAMGLGLLGKGAKALKVTSEVLKAGDIAKWSLSPATKISTGVVRAVRGNGYLQDMARLGLRAKSFPAPKIAAMDIAQGRVASATLKGFGLALKAPRAVFMPGARLASDASLGAKAANAVGRYARGAYRIQLGGLAVQAGSGVASDLLDEPPESGFFAGIHKMSTEIMEDRPLSNSSAFVMASAFGLPIHTLVEPIGQARGAIKTALGDPDKVLWSEWLGRDLSGKSAVRDVLGTKRGKGKQAGLIEAFGGEENWRKAVFHTDMKIAYDDMMKYHPVAQHFSSFDDLITRSDYLGKVVAEHAAEMRAAGRIKPRQRLETFEDMARARYHTITDRMGNNLKDIREPLDFDLNPEQIVKQWNDYSNVIEGMYNKFGPTARGIIGRAKRLTKEDLGALRAFVESEAKDGRVAVEPLRGLLSETAAMFNDPIVLDNAERITFWRRIMSAEGGNGQYSERPLAGVRKPRERTVDSGELLSQLDALEKEAPTGRELYGEAALAEKAAPDDLPASAGPIQNGRMRQIYSHATLRRYRIMRNRQLRKVTRALEDQKQAFERKWTKRGNLRVHRGRKIGGETPSTGVNEIRAEVARLGLPDNETSAVEALMQARAEVWSHETGRPAVEWLPLHIKEFRQGGALRDGSLLQIVEPPRVTELRRELAATTDSSGTILPDQITRAHEIQREIESILARDRGITDWPTIEALHQSKGEDVAGATRFLRDGRAVVQAFEKSDLSTAVHELGHVFRRDLTPEHLATAEKHYGVVDGAWDTVHEESFARDFERYVRDGKAPTKALAPIFSQLRDFMVRIYRTLKGSPLANKISPEMREVFDSLFKPAANSMHDLARSAAETGDLSILPDGVPNAVEAISRRDDGVTLVKYDENGAPAGILDMALENGKAAQNGILEHGTPAAIEDLYGFADRAGYDAEQAALVSDNLTPEMKANQKFRWDNQRAQEQSRINAAREQARSIRRDLREADKQIERLRTVRIDERFFDENGQVKTDQKSLEKLREQQLWMVDNGYTRSYNLEPAPKLAYRYTPEQSHLAALLRERSMLGTMLVDYGPLSKAFHALDALTRPINSSKMAHDARQMLMNKLIAMGAKPKEVDSFLNSVREALAHYSVSKADYALFRGRTALPPNKINALAREAFQGNKTFEASLAKRGGFDRMHTIMDESYNSAVRAIDTKILRGQKLNPLESIFRSGYWAWQNAPGLRQLSDGTRMVSRVVYPMFRFIFDPRWLLQNTIEADIIGFFQDGIGATRLARTAEKTVKRQGQEVNISRNALAYHAAQSGLGNYLPRFVKEEVGKHPALSADLANEAGVTSINAHLYPVLRRQFDIRRPETIRKILDDLPKNDPVIALLQQKFGKEKGTWAEQLDEMLYSFDRRGVRRTMDEAVRRVSKYEKWTQAEFDQMQPLVSKLVERNQQLFEDLTQMHIGNVNRSRIERVMNSFWLYWPLSYQIKAAKWLATSLTKRSFGAETNLGGAWALNRLGTQFRERIENDDDFRRFIEDNDDLWFVAAMALPIAPWDAGVSLNKLVRYTGGNVFDLWPEYAGLDNPGDYALRMLEMGPLYTVKLANRLWDHFLSDKDNRQAA